MASVKNLVVTLNCGRRLVKPDVFAQHLTAALGNLRHEIIVFSLQEIAPIYCSFLGHSYLKLYYRKIHQTVERMVRIWGDESKYVNVFEQNLGMTALLIFARNDVLKKLKYIESGCTGVGWLETGNKGAVGARIGYGGLEGEIIDLTFIAAHLAPMEWGLERRNQDWMNVVRRLVFEKAWGLKGSPSDEVQPSEDPPGLEEAEEIRPLLQSQQDQHESINERNTGLTKTIYQPMSYVIVAGDLNYRTSIERPKPTEYSKYPKESRDSKSISELLERDQLTHEISAGKTLHGFREAPIRFPPTYKYSSQIQREVAKHEQDGSIEEYSKDSSLPFQWAVHRWPSWCDRVLYLPPFAEPMGAEATIFARLYTCLPLMSTSDHRAVISSFSIQLSRPVSTNDKRLADKEDYRLSPPYQVDPLWRRKYETARRWEFAIGLLSYMGSTWEGNGILVLGLFSTIGSIALIGILLNNSDSRASPLSGIFVG